MQGKITLPGIAICIKLQCNLYQMSGGFNMQMHRPQS